jgi:4-hydroxybenzoate polyprenyltransferase
MRLWCDADGSAAVIIDYTDQSGRWTIDATDAIDGQAAPDRRVPDGRVPTERVPTGRVRAMILAGHPGPTLANTAMIVALTFAGRPGIATVVIFTIAVLAGELSIGWANDVFDAATDAAAGRADKPIVTGRIDRQSVAIAAMIALAVGVIAAFVVSIETGVLNLAMMAAGWAYNAGLKRTLLSGVMFVIGFGLIPAFSGSVLPHQPWPLGWTTGAAALLGLGGHFANVLPDLAADRVSGVRGLPQRIAGLPHGALAVRLICLTLLLGASVLLVLAPAGAPHWWQLVGLSVTGALAVVGAVASGRTPFRAAMAIAGLDVVLFLTRV